MCNSSHLNGTFKKSTGMVRMRLDTQCKRLLTLFSLSNFFVSCYINIWSRVNPIKQKTLGCFQVIGCELLWTQVTHPRLPVNIQVYLLHFKSLRLGFNCFLTIQLDRYHVPKFPHSSATFNIISGFRILTSPKVLQGALGNSACPTQCSQPCPMPANRHLTGLTWFPIVLYYIK